MNYNIQVVNIHFRNIILIPFEHFNMVDDSSHQSIHVWDPLITMPFAIVTTLCISLCIVNPSCSSIWLSIAFTNFFDHDAIIILLWLHHLNQVNLHDIPHKNQVILTIVNKVLKVKKKGR
jgi:hypothetical protein